MSSSIHEAAAQIVALINSSPRSPTQEEIEAIVARALSPPQQAEPDPRLAAWRKRVADYQAAGAKGDRDDAAMDALLRDLDAHARAIWATPARTFADVLLRVELAKEWNSPVDIRDPEYPLCILQKGDGASIDDLALAHVVQAILQLGKCNFSLPAATASPAELGEHPPTKPVTCLADIDFEPVVGPDGKAIEFNYTNDEFADAFCPTIRMAFALLGRDKDGVCEVVRSLTENDPDGDLLMDLLRNWEIVENKFAAISKFAEMAQARTMLVGELMDATP